MLEYYFVHTFEKSKVALSMLYQMLIYSISVLFIIYGDYIIFFINNFSSKHSSGARIQEWALKKWLTPGILHSLKFWGARK